MSSVPRECSGVALFIRHGLRLRTADASYGDAAGIKRASGASFWGVNTFRILKRIGWASMLGTFEEEFSKIEYEYYHPKDDLLATLSKSNARAVIFGAGAVGKVIANRLLSRWKTLNGKIAAFCDNFKTGNCDEFHIPIVSPQELFVHYQDAIIIVAVNNDEINAEIYRQILDMGFQQEKIFRCYLGYEFNEGIYNIDGLNKYRDGYKWAYEFFEDTISKKIILNRMRRYLACFDMEHSPVEEQYFEKDVIRLSEREVFVDGGSYTGDTALAFIRRMEERYDFIYGFEPERKNFDKAKSNLENYRDIELINKGLWSKTAQLSFHVDNIASTIAENGEIFISVISLDEFFATGETKRLPTFIKLDIEGAEKQALLGMKNVIAQSHPKLAISVYHKPEDIYELPQLIMKLGKGYKFTLRHYTACMYDTVLYAT